MGEHGWESPELVLTYIEDERENVKVKPAHEAEGTKGEKPCSQEKLAVSPDTAQKWLGPAFGV